MKNQKKLIECLKKTSIIQIACQQADISRATYYRWREKDEKFKQKTDKAKKEGFEVINDLAETGLIKAIKNDNITAIFYRLNHCHPDYSDKRLYLSNSDQKQLIDDISAKNIKNIFGLLIEKLIKGEISKSVVNQVVLMINKVYTYEAQSSHQQELRKTLTDMANLIDELRPNSNTEQQVDQPIIQEHPKDLPLEP
jgi:signal recognition particle GTPase